MAVLTKEEFFSQLQSHIGTSDSEDNIEFLENMTDTYNDLANRAKGDGIDWQQKYKELDKSWREKYSHRFFSSPSINNPNEKDKEEEEIIDRANTIKITDLFK